MADAGCEGYWPEEVCLQEEDGGYNDDLVVEAYLWHRGLSWRIEDNRHYGRCSPFLYYNGEPLCIVGPDCTSF